MRKTYTCTYTYALTCMRIWTVLHMHIRALTHIHTHQHMGKWCYSWKFFIMVNSIMLYNWFILIEVSMGSCWNPPILPRPGRLLGSNWLLLVIRNCSLWFRKERWSFPRPTLGSHSRAGDRWLCAHHSRRGLTCTGYTLSLILTTMMFARKAKW